MNPTFDQSLVTLRVRRRTIVATNVVRLDLEYNDRSALPAWEAGAHLDLRLHSGLTRQYSLCGDQYDRTSYSICVLRESHGRGGSEEIFRDLDEGSQVRASFPRNHFRMAETSKSVLIAGGIGITPIKAMALQADAQGSNWHLHYGGRDLEHMAFVDELAAYGPERVSIVPQDSGGMLDVVSIVREVPEDAHLYCCGPSPLLEAVINAAAEAGISDRLHYERFEAAPDRPVSDLARDIAFEVELRASGMTLQVPPDKSLLDVVQEVRPDIAFSCTEGYCGSCESIVLEGIPDHRGSLMSDAEHDEEGTMLICVGRSRTPRLVLDL